LGRWIRGLLEQQIDFQIIDLLEDYISDELWRGVGDPFYGVKVRVAGALEHDE